MVGKAITIEKAINERGKELIPTKKADRLSVTALKGEIDKSPIIIFIIKNGQLNTKLFFSRNMGATDIIFACCMCVNSHKSFQNNSTNKFSSIGNLFAQDCISCCLWMIGY